MEANEAFRVSEDGLIDALDAVGDDLDIGDREPRQITIRCQRNGDVGYTVEFYDLGETEVGFIPAE